MPAASPVRGVVTELYGDYFAGSEMNVAGMSSHWREYAGKSSVQLDADGVPIDAVGIGFGDMNSRRLGNAVLTPIAAAVHAVMHPMRSRVPGALRMAWTASRRAGLVFNQNALRQALTAALLSGHLGNQPVRRVLMIGDGYGLLGGLLKQMHPSAQIVFMDLGRSLLFQAMTSGRLFPSASHGLVGRDDEDAISCANFVYCPADRLEEWARRPIDLAVNIASMQEMSAEAIAGYFRLLRQSPTTWFYCCNRERKVMPGGEVAEFMKYPWDARDVHEVDSLCPWHQWYLAPHRSAGLVPLSLRVPYDGAHLHRLTRLAPSQGSV